MRPRLSLKTLFRAPFKTLMTILLIAAASFSLFSRVADYMITSREMKNAAGFYRGTASLDTGVPDTTEASSLSRLSADFPTPPALTTGQIEAFSSLPSVTSTDIRYMTAGIPDESKRPYGRVRRYAMYATPYDYNTRIVMEGTFEKLRLEGHSILLTFTDIKALANPVPTGNVNSYPPLRVPTNAEDIAAYRNDGAGLAHNEENLWGYALVQTLVKGERYLIIGSVQLTGYTWTRADYTRLGYADTVDYRDMLRPLSGEPDNYLETEKFADIREMLRMTNQDIKTFDMVYTSDMMSIPRFAEERMIIQEGRALAPDDTDACVISLSLMRRNLLQIGDKITVNLCDRLVEQHAGIGALAVIPERLGNPVKTVELEIAGAYIDTDTSAERAADEYTSYSLNTIFLPLSQLPVEPPANHPIYPGEFSVIIGDARMITSFQADADRLAEETGLAAIRFSDGGWLRIENELVAGTVTSQVTALLFILAAAVALLLAVYLYIGREKKNFAIMRALGTTRGRARRTLSLPFALLSALAIPLGGAAGLSYTSRTVSSSLEALAAAVTAEYIPDISIPYEAAAICLICEIVFLMLLSALFLRRLSRIPPLELLQGGAVRAAVKIAEERNFLPPNVVEFSGVHANTIPVISGGSLPRNYGAVRHVTRYILRHMRRAGWKTALALTLALLLTGGLGLFALARLNYQEMFDNLEVKGYFTSFSADTVADIAQSELTESLYYHGNFPVASRFHDDCDPFEPCDDCRTPYTLNITNDIGRCLRGDSPDEAAVYTITYGEGFDASFWAGEEDNVVFAGRAFADKCGIGIGGTVNMTAEERMGGFARQINNVFTVAGIITSESEQANNSLFTTLSGSTMDISRYGRRYPYAVSGEFTLTDNERPYELLDHMKEVAKLSRKNATLSGMLYNLDMTELDNIKRVRDLLIMLFPIAVAAAVFIGLTAPGLIILQSVKEAAILRILGTTKSRARCMLAAEQIILCVLGLSFAAFGLVMYNSGLFVRSAETLAVCGGLYLFGCAFAVMFAAVSVTRHKVLELLQVKE